MIGFNSQMETALIEARAARDRGEVPVGAVITAPGGKIIATAGNRTRELNDPSAHAELLAIRIACKVLGREKLTGCHIYVTLEPCAMCAGAISLARLERLYYGTSDPKSGGVEQGARVFEQPQCHHRPEVYSGISETECRQVLQDFFAERRG